MRGRVWRRTRWVLCLSYPLLAGTLAACQASQSPDAADSTQVAPATEAAPQLASLNSVAEVRRDSVSGVVLYAASRDLAVALAADPSYLTAKEQGDVGGMALQFLGAYRNEFLIAHPPSEFKVGEITEDTLGFRRVRLQQVFKGISVVGAELSLQFNGELALELLQGRYIPTPQVTPDDPALSSADAARIAANELGKIAQLSEPEMIIYPRPDGSGALAYQITATSGLTESWRMTIDASTGDALAKEPLRYPSQLE